ncbi:MAG: hypothetical protein ACOC54_05860, partial [Candidatus Sumerlaeota bacterium]
RQKRVYGFIIAVCFRKIKGLGFLRILKCCGRLPTEERYALKRDAGKELFRTGVCKKLSLYLQSGIP